MSQKKWKLKRKIEGSTKKKWVDIIGFVTQNRKMRRKKKRNSKYTKRSAQ